MLFCFMVHFPLLICDQVLLSGAGTMVAKGHLSSNVKGS